MEHLSLRELIARTIATRDPLQDWCGNPINWADMSEGHRECYRGDADAILTIPGIAVVELPEPERPRVGRCIWLDDLVTVNSGDIDLDYQSISATDARDLAAALLAAADYAERDQ